MLPGKRPGGNSVGSVGKMVSAAQPCLRHKEASVGNNMNKQAWLKRTREAPSDLQAWFPDDTNICSLSPCALEVGESSL